MANTRLALGAEAEAGDKLTASVWQLAHGSCSTACPENFGQFSSGAIISFGNEAIMGEAEERRLHYLSTLRLASNVK